MRFNDSNYNRRSASLMYEWQDEEWIVDKNGLMRLRDDEEINTMTISPLYSEE